MQKKKKKSNTDSKNLILPARLIATSDKSPTFKNGLIHKNNY